ncbi:SRPBCC family protein [Geodermatophilus sp. SYSU D00079]
MTQHDAHARRGVVRPGADGRQRLEFRRSWPDPVDDVWAAITEPDRLARWIGRYEGERGPGGTGTFTMAFEEGEHTGAAVRIVECDPPRRLVVEWTAEELGWRLELDLSSDGDTTTLVFSQALAPGMAAGDVLGGWHWYLDRLDAEVAGTAGPGEWEPFWAEVGPLYGRGGAG